MDESKWQELEWAFAALKVAIENARCRPEPVFFKRQNSAYYWFAEKLEDVMAPESVEPAPLTGPDSPHPLPLTTPDK